MQNMEGTKNFGAFIDRTLRIIRLDLGKRLKQVNVDITPEQWMILSSLYNNNGQSQTELCNDSFKNAPTVSRIIDLLSKKGYTERQRFENDRRSYKIFLTEEGKAVVEKALPAIIATRAKGWTDLTDEDYEGFIKVLNKFLIIYLSNGKAS